MDASVSVHVGGRSDGNTVRGPKVRKGRHSQGTPSTAGPVSAELAFTAVTEH